MTNQNPYNPSTPTPQGQPGQPAGYNPPPVNFQANQDERAISAITYSYWLSVFFVWIPAVIYYFSEKNKAPQFLAYHRDNLNFSLIRFVVVTIGNILFYTSTLTPYGLTLFFISGALFLFGFLLFIFHLITAAGIANKVRAGQEPGFVFNIPIVS